jgi:hypothetical protein
VKRWWTGLAIVAILAATGCGGGSSVPSPSPSLTSGIPRLISGVEGRVLLFGGPMVANHSPTPQPYPASEVAAFDSSGRLVALVQPNRNAAFRIELSPGSYTLKARPTAGNPWFAPRRVSVEAGAFAHVDLVTQVP